MSRHLPRGQPLRDVSNNPPQPQGGGAKNGAGQKYQVIDSSNASSANVSIQSGGSDCCEVRPQQEGAMAPHQQQDCWHPAPNFGGGPLLAAPAATSRPSATFDEVLYPERNDDPCFVSEYVAEIVEHLLASEQRCPRDATYLSRQTEITERMRTILVDWMVDVIIKFKLHPETFHLAVDIVDRFLAEAKGERATLQLVGITAILIAAKHDEIWPPEVKECVYISANTYSRDEVLKMERRVAEALRFRFTVPTPYPFLNRLLAATNSPTDVCTLSSMFLDTAALEYSILRFPSSVVAAGAMLLACATYHNNAAKQRGLAPLAQGQLQANLDGVRDVVWPRSHHHHCRVASFDEIAACAVAILNVAHTHHAPTSRYQAVRRKYSSEKQDQVFLRYELPAEL